MHSPIRRAANYSPSIDLKTEAHSKILDLSPTNHNLKDEPQDFATFYKSLHPIPQLSDKTPRKSLHGRTSSLPLISGSSSPNTGSILSRKSSIARSPVSNRHILSRRKNTSEFKLTKPILTDQTPTSPLKVRVVTPIRSGNISPGGLSIDITSRSLRNKAPFSSSELLLSERRLTTQKVRSFRDSMRFTYQAAHASNNLSHNESPLLSSGISSLNMNHLTDLISSQRSNPCEIENDEKRGSYRLKGDGVFDFTPSSSRLLETEGNFYKDNNHNFSLKPQPVIGSEARPSSATWKSKLLPQTGPVSPEELERLRSQRNTIMKGNLYVDVKLPEGFGDFNKYKSKSVRGLPDDKGFKMKERVNIKEGNDWEYLKKIKERDHLAKFEKALTGRERDFLDLVEEGDNIKELELMIDNNKDLVFIKDSIKQTPLHHAVKKGHLKVVELLCKYGADMNAMDTAMRSPMSIAKKLMMNRIIRYFEKLQVPVKESMVSK